MLPTSPLDPPLDSVQPRVPTDPADSAGPAPGAPGAPGAPAAPGADARRSGPLLDPAIAAALSKDAAGLVAAVVQQYDTLEVLMLGWMDEEALRRTLTSGRVTFWSRSRSEYWRKGDTSGHRQWVRGVALDCDGDAVLVTVDQEGAACHTGTRTCFDGRELPVTGRAVPPDGPYDEHRDPAPDPAPDPSREAPLEAPLDVRAGGL